MHSIRPIRLRRLAVLLGLAANLVAAGVPLLHVLLHEVHERGAHHHSTGHLAGLSGDVEPVDPDHPASDVHPQALHDDVRAVKPDVAPFPFPALAIVPPETVEAELERRTSGPPGSLRSRAPPPGDPARAPPLV